MRKFKKLFQLAISTVKQIPGSIARIGNGCDSHCPRSVNRVEQVEHHSGSSRVPEIEAAIAKVFHQAVGRKGLEALVYEAVRARVENMPAMTVDKVPGLLIEHCIAG